MFIFLTILILLAAVLLILVVVIQNSKGGGLASGFSTGNQVLGVRKTTDFLEKTTWVLLGSIIVLSVASTAFIPKANVQRADFQKQVQQSIQVQDQPVLPSTSLPTDQPAKTPTEPAEQPTQPAQ